MTGHVEEKFEKDGEPCVDLEISIDTGQGLAYKAGWTPALSS